MMSLRNEVGLATRSMYEDGRPIKKLENVLELMMKKLIKLNMFFITFKMHEEIMRIITFWA